MVLVRDIPLYSHVRAPPRAVPRRAHVAYIPGDDGRITGLSKLARLVDGFAKRPQVQERLTTQIADAIVEVLQPRGAFVMIEAEHLCMSMRGVRKPGTLTLTSAVRGLFKDSAGDPGRGHGPHRAVRRPVLTGSLTSGRGRRTPPPRRRPAAARR